MHVFGTMPARGVVHRFDQRAADTFAVFAVERGQILQIAGQPDVRRAAVAQGMREPAGPAVTLRDQREHRFVAIEGARPSELRDVRR